MSDSEQITPPQLGCCQQEASWPVSCTYLPLHLLSRVHALELPLHFPEPEDKVMLLFVVFFCFLNHSHDTYFEHQLQQQIEGYPAKRAEKVLQITPKTIYQEDQIKSSKNSGRISVTKNHRRAHS